MEDVLNLLKSMGAESIDFDESPVGAYSSKLTFEYKGKRAEMCGVWFNTQEAGIEGLVKELD